MIAMKKEFDYGDYPPERFAHDAAQAIQDLLDVADMSKEDHDLFSDAMALAMRLANE